MIDAEVLALEEINASGGILGRPLRWVIADGASDPATFARQAERLIRDDGVTVVFGCWTSASRKSVLPIVEAADHLLVYPMAYEGLEQSPNIVYTGAAPNQQITPAVQWCYNTLGARRFFLIGSDYIWPHCVNAIISDQLAGLGAERIGEAYIPFGSTDVEAAVRAIVAAQRTGSARNWAMVAIPCGRAALARRSDASRLTTDACRPVFCSRISAPGAPAKGADCCQ
jgi:urea transport system substrate-binding protein